MTHKRTITVANEHRFLWTVLNKQGVMKIPDCSCRHDAIFEAVHRHSKSILGEVFCCDSAVIRKLWRKLYRKGFRCVKINVQAGIDACLEEAPRCQ